MNQKTPQDTDALPATTGYAFPAQCPACGKPKVEGWVRGWQGWECGSFSQAHDHDRGNGLNFRQSIQCATVHWKQRALRAEYLLTLIPIPPHNADVDAQIPAPTKPESITD